MITPKVMASVMQTVERRLWLGQHMPRCPICSTQQVQLVDARPLAEWKCRECKRTKWRHEPIKVMR
jgi:hypothetical protein